MPKDHEQRQARGAQALTATFDVFLSHNSRDKPLVERLAEKLKRAGIEPWLDKWCLVPGADWQEGLAAGVRASSSCAVFVGPSDLGAWAQQEVALALDRAAQDRDFRVFLVLLPGVPDQFDPTTLPPFLSLRTWVDFRRGADDDRALQAVIKAIKGIPLGPDVPLEPRQGVRPYRGLEVFDEEHADLFFGRDGEIQRLLEKLKSTRFLAVVGASGSGKSSLVRAGVIPRLRGSAAGDNETWTIGVLTPGPRPLETLAARLLKLSAEGTMQRTLDELREDPRSLHLATTLALPDAPAGARVMWVIDQFEEVFTLCRDPDERAAFIANLLYAASIPDGRCTVVLTMRADFYHRCLAYPELAQQLAAQQFAVSPMDEEGLRQAIEEPARRVGLELEPGLVATILEDVAEQPGALPLLEHALLELWERRAGGMLTLAGYRESGGVRGAVAARADVVFSSFTPEQQEIARRGLLRLTQPGEGTEDTRRRAELSELATDEETLDDVEAVVQQLVRARLLTTGTEDVTGEQWVDVAHEALIRGWPRLQAWIDEDRAGLRTHRRLTEAAQDWEEHERDEGLLFRGSRLAEAEVWRERHDALLNPLERRFLDASVSLRDRESAALEERRRRELEQAEALAAEQRARADEAARGRARARRLTAFLAFSFVAVLVVATLALLARQTAINERNRAIPGQLAAQSQATLRDFPARGLLLAVEAQRAMMANDVDVPAADTALTEALSFTGGAVLARQTSDVTASAVSHDSSTVAIGMKNGSVQVASLASTSRGRVALLDGPRRDVAEVFFSADDRWLVVTHRDLRTDDENDRIVRLWDLRPSPPQAHVLPGEGKRFGSVSISPDGRWLLARTTTDRSVRLWDLQAAASPPRSTVLAGPGAGAVETTISPSGRWVVVIAGAERRARLWDLTRGRWTAVPGVRAALMGDAGNAPVRSWQSLWVVTSGGGTTTLWDVTAEQPLRRPLRLARPLGEVHSLTASRDGRWLVGAEPYGLLIWRLSGTQPGSPTRVASPGSFLERIAISRNSRWLIVTASTQLGYGGQLGIVNLAASLPAGRDSGGWSYFGTSTLSSAGRRLARTDLETGIIRVSDLGATSGPQPPTVVVSALGRAVTSFFVTADERSLVAAVDKTVGILDVRQLCEAECTISPTVLHGHEDQVTSAIVSPDLRRLVTHSADRTTRLWDLRNLRSGAERARPKVTNANRAALIARACRAAGRNLTRAEWTTYFGDADYRRSCLEYPGQ